MKRKIILVFINMLCVLFFSACGVGHVHDWGDWQVTTQPTCTTGGVETRVCKSDPTHTETRNTSIDPSAHSYGEWQTYIPATCLQRQGKDVRECSLCHNKIYRDTEYSGGHVIENNECKICHTPCTEGFQFTEIKDGETTVAYMISGMDASEDEEILIPDKHGGLPVTEITNNAIVQNSAVEKIYLPDSIKAIKVMAFRSNPKLKSVYVGSGVEVFERNSFMDCAALTEIIVAESNKNYATENGILFNKEKTEIISVPDGLTAAKLPDSLTVISAQAFNGHSALESVEFGANVTEIGVSAFYNSGLTSVTIPEKTVKINDNAFHNCKNLKTVIWNAEACTEAYLYVFTGCAALDTIKIGKNVKSMPMNTFSPLTAENIKVDIEDMSAWCNIQFTDYRQNPLYFAHNLYLNGAEATEIVIPADVTALNYTFASCHNIEKVSFEAGSALVSIGDWAFTGCSKLAEITLPASLESITKGAFKNCKQLTKATFDNPEGWMMSTSADMTENQYVWESELLGDIEQNATYLTGYASYYWKRNNA